MSFQQDEAPDAQSTNLLHGDVCPPVSLPYSPNNISWDHLPKKSLPLESLSEGVLLEKPKLRQIANALSRKLFRTKEHYVRLMLLYSLRILSELLTNFTLILENNLKY